MLYNYLKIALRNLLRHKNHTIINVGGLALGITGSILLFLLLNFHWSTDRYHTQANRIYRVVTELHLENGSIEYDPGTPFPLAKAIQNDFPQIKKVAFIVRNQPLTIEVPKMGRTTPTRYLEKEGISFTSPQWFEIFDYQWLAGDPKQALAEPNAVVLTQKWAKKYFGKENPVGKMLKINQAFTFKVTGLLQDFPDNTDTKANMFVSLASYKIIRPDFPEDDWTWIDRNKETFMVLPPNYTAEQFERTLPAFSDKYHGENAQFYQHHLQALHEVHFDERFGGAMRKPLLYGLSLIGIGLIVIAGINFINLATVQSLGRAKEVGVRKVLGSSQTQLFWQFISETTLIALLATSLSLASAKFALPYLNEWTQLPIQLNVSDTALWLFLLVLVVAIIFLAGFYPAIILSNFNPVQALKGRLASRQTGKVSLRKTLVITQFIIAQTLLVSTLVVSNQMNLFRNSDLGFKTNALVMVPLPEPAKGKMEVFRSQLSQNPGVKGVSFCYRAPASTANNGGSFKYDSHTEWEIFPIRYKWADANYLNTFGLKLITGRNLRERGRAREFLVNETLLRKLNISNPNQIIGKSLTIAELGEQPGTVVGVVKDFHLQSFHTPIDPCVIAAVPSAYQYAGVVLKGNRFSQTLSHIREKWQALYPQHVFEYQFLDDQIALFYATEEMLGKLIQAFTWLTILISCLGLYGLVSFATVQRTKEIGIRKILGASVSSIVALFSKDFLRPVLLANVIAWPLAWWAMQQWLQGFAYRISISWWMFALAGIAALFIALITVSFRTIRAAIANPVKALRNE